MYRNYAMDFKQIFFESLLDFVFAHVKFKIVRYLQTNFAIKRIACKINTERKI